MKYCGDIEKATKGIRAKVKRWVTVEDCCYPKDHTAGSFCDLCCSLDRFNHLWRGKLTTTCSTQAANIANKEDYETIIQCRLASSPSKVSLKANLVVIFTTVPSNKTTHYYLDSSFGNTSPS